MRSRQQTIAIILSKFKKKHSGTSKSFAMQTPRSYNRNDGTGKHVVKNKGWSRSGSWTCPDCSLVMPPVKPEAKNRKWAAKAKMMRAVGEHQGTHKKT